MKSERQLNLHISAEVLRFLRRRIESSPIDFPKSTERRSFNEEIFSFSFSNRFFKEKTDFFERNSVLSVDEMKEEGDLCNKLKISIMFERIFDEFTNPSSIFCWV